MIEDGIILDEAELIEEVWNEFYERPVELRWVWMDRMGHIIDKEVAESMTEEYLEKKGYRLFPLSSQYTLSQGRCKSSSLTKYVLCDNIYV